MLVDSGIACIGGGKICVTDALGKALVSVELAASVTIIKGVKKVGGTKARGVGECFIVCSSDACFGRLNMDSVAADSGL